MVLRYLVFCILISCEVVCLNVFWRCMFEYSVIGELLVV